MAAYSATELSLGDRHFELVRVVLGVPALGALDTHPDDYRDFIVHDVKRASCGIVPEARISAEFVRILGGRAGRSIRRQTANSGQSPRAIDLPIAAIRGDDIYVTMQSFAAV
jgi:predicted methyltransferase